jgi:hypothetical protein
MGVVIGMPTGIRIEDWTREVERLKMSEFRQAYQIGRIDVGAHQVDGVNLKVVLW